MTFDERLFVEDDQEDDQFESQTDQSQRLGLQDRTQQPKKNLGLPKDDQQEGGQLELSQKKLDRKIKQEK